MITKVNDLEGVLKLLGSKKPFLHNSSNLELTNEGGTAYEKLINILNCIGDITSKQNYISRIIDNLDDIVDNVI